LGRVHAAAVQSVVIQSLMYPIVLPVAVDMCWINSTAGSKFIVISGYYKP
jgi:hypothetical protein